MVILNTISPSQLMPFQFNAKNVFLTYAQFNEPKEDLLEHLVNLCPGTNIVVAHELHQDGGHHLHSYIQAPEAIRTRDVAYFDFRGKHPNIVSAKNPKKCYDYVTKERNYVTHGSFVFKNGKSWADALQATTADAFKEIIKENNPRDYILQFDKITHFAETHYACKKTPYESRYAAESFNATDTMMDWVIQAFDQVRGAPSSPGLSSLPLLPRDPCGTLDL